jgi:hypothetical protein
VIRHGHFILGPSREPYMDDRPNHLIKDNIITGYVMPALLIEYSNVMIIVIRYNVPLIMSKNQGRHSFQSNGQ